MARLKCTLCVDMPTRTEVVVTSDEGGRTESKDHDEGAQGAGCRGRQGGSSMGNGVEGH